MTNARQSQQQKVSAAFNRAEDAIADLLREAENWTLVNRPMWDIRVHRRDLLAAARKYARAMDRLTRVRR